MASSINASSSGAGGLISSGDSSGALDIQTAGTTAIAISSSQAVTIQGLTVGRGGGAGASNTAVGNLALRDNTTGNNNAAFGLYALVQNTSGNTNTAFGSNSLYSNTTASNNTAVGYQSLYANTTGIYNTAIGSGALYANTTGPQNVAVGFNAASSSNSTGITAIGSYSLRNNTSGQSNTAVGSYDGSSTIGAPLWSNTTGAFNTAMGTGALSSNTTASNNTAVGYQAGYSNTTNNNNTSVGYQALYASTAVGNTALGAYAGDALTTGGFNTILGYVAGGNATTGTYNTFIGTGSGLSITTGAKNSILGCYDGNQGGLDIRTSSNNIVLSDGDGNPRYVYRNGSNHFGGASPAGFGGNALIVPTYDGSNQPGMRFYDTWASSDASTAINFIRNGTSVGQIYTTNTATAYVTSSDYRLKENVQPMTGALAKVAQLKPCTYTWKSSDADGQGFIAHELQEVFPDAVYGEKDGVDKDGNPDYQGIDTSFLVATLTAAIQELNAKVTELEAQLGAK